jgi:hypothetical protein
MMTPATEVTKGGCEGSGGNLGWPPTDADQDWCQDRAAADSVNATRTLAILGISQT